MSTGKVQIWPGTSGYSYPPWIGPFYPEGSDPKSLLSVYAERLPSVEINQTFYRMPRRQVVESWASQVGASFRFVLKASRRITHQKRLQDVEGELTFLLESAGALGERLGALLFQLPPYLRCDLERLERFLDQIPEATPAAFELRHPSWHDAPTHELLRSRARPLVLVDSEDGEPTLIETAPFGYLRLRRADYSHDDLVRWTRRIQSQSWEHAFVFFKHEDAALGPLWARAMMELAGAPA